LRLPEFHLILRTRDWNFIVNMTNRLLPVFQLTLEFNNKGDFIGMNIYSVSPLGAFQGMLLTIGGVLAIGVVGLVYAILQRRQGKKGWVGLGIAGLFLCLMGILVLGVTVANMSTSTQTVTVRLDQKTVAEDNCGEGSTCTRYILGMTAAPMSYDFTVARRAYDAVQEGQCYQVVYYPNKGLFAADANADGYVASSYITRITQADPGACQP